MDTLRRHLADHSRGRLGGSIPASFMEANRLTQCTVCSKILSTRFGNACPTCRPRLRPDRQAGEGRSIPDDMPSFQDVLKSGVRTRTHVPKGVRDLWAQCLIMSIAQVLKFNDERSWLELYMLPQVVLRAPSRGGKGHHKRIDAESKSLCRAWLEGHRGSLWQKSRSRPQRGRPNSHHKSDSLLIDPQGDMKDKRALELLREGLLQKACGALTQSAPVAATPEIVREMEAKHPQARETEPSRLSHLRPINAAAASQVDRERLLDALRSFPKGSAGGPCGLRPQHLKDALVAGWADEVVRHLTDLVNLLARGEAAVEVQQWLCGASLAALPKPAGDHRPVAVGETLRRLTSKALASMHSDEARIFLEPVQVGVGTKSGCEAIVHSVRQWMVRNKNSTDKVLVKVDLSNAFNCVDRSAVLDAVRLVSPG